MESLDVSFLFIPVDLRQYLIGYIYWVSFLTSLYVAYNLVVSETILGKHFTLEVLEKFTPLLKEDICGLHFGVSHPYVRLNELQSQLT